MSESSPRPVSLSSLRLLHPHTSGERPYGFSAGLLQLLYPVMSPALSRNSRRQLELISNRAMDRIKRQEDQPDVVKASNEKDSADFNLSGDEALIRSLAVAALTQQRVTGLSVSADQMFAASALTCGHLLERNPLHDCLRIVSLAAGASAVVGRRVHVLTCDEARARDHFDANVEFFKALGLDAAILTQSMTQNEKNRAYQANIIVGAARDVAFDYLRCRVALGAEAGPVHFSLARLSKRGAASNELRMPGLHFAILDHADRLLLEEARAPIVISEYCPPDVNKIATTLAMARELREGVDFEIGDGGVKLLEKGVDNLRALSDRSGGYWRNSARRDALVLTALAALHVYQQGTDYILEKGRLVIAPTSTAAQMASRSDDIQQLLEAKEGLAISRSRKKVGQVTLQRFFRRYKGISGICGGIPEDRAELLASYNLPCVQQTPPAPPPTMSETICRDAEAKWRIIADRVRDLTRTGAHVVIAAESLDSAMNGGAVLNDDALNVPVLTERPGKATGTPAQSQPGSGAAVIAVRPQADWFINVESLGATEGSPIHVIVADMPETRRLTRDYAALASQGGAIAYVLSWDDPLIGAAGGPLAKLKRGGFSVFASAQKRAERRFSSQRQALLKYDLQREKQLAFTGVLE